MTERSARVLLRSLALRDFRNLGRVDLVFPAAGVAIVGENGQGKSNLLEAIYYLHLLRSVRGARDVDVVRFGAPGFHISARTEGGAHHELVAGAPSARRRYLDILLALSSRPYLMALQRYRHALAQRNAALRDAQRSAQSEQRIAVWEAPLAQHGAVLWRERVAWADRASDRFSEMCGAIGERVSVGLRYATALEPASGDLADIAAALTESLAQKRGLDVRRGLTHTGPHRDDLALTLDGRELRAFGSAGQQRTAAIALRLLEGETLRERLGAAPLLLLDDPFAELDVRRSARILELLAEHGMGQTLLTVPRDTDIPPALTQLARWSIADGIVRTTDNAHEGRGAA